MREIESVCCAFSTLLSFLGNRSSGFSTKDQISLPIDHWFGIFSPISSNHLPFRRCSEALDHWSNSSIRILRSLFSLSLLHSFRNSFFARKQRWWIELVQIDEMHPCKKQQKLATIAKEPKKRRKLQKVFNRGDEIRRDFRKAKKWRAKETQKEHAEERNGFRCALRERARVSC